MPSPLLSLAWRDSRTARRRLALYMSAISLGVAALVAIDSFALNVTRSIREQSRALLGGDLAFTSRTKFPAAVDSMFDSLRTQGTEFATQVTFGSMAQVVRTGGTRLAQVRSVTENYPFYGDVITEPANQWATLHTKRVALVDESLLIALNGVVGDSLTLGYTKFVIGGILKNVPGDPGVAATIGPRIFISQQWVAETKLLVFGSRAEYETLARLRDTSKAKSVAAAIKPKLEPFRVRVRTVQENEQNFTQAIAQLGDFLGIVGLVALLLGGIGVASGVTAYVARKIDVVAVLRCLGATSWQVLGIYAAQAGAMGFAGAAIGVLIGLGIQQLMPAALGDFLPVDVRIAIEPKAVLTGLGIGVWTALLFAMRPLVALRNVSPLQAIRRDTDGGALRTSWRDPLVIAVNAALVLSVVGMAIWRSPKWTSGVALAGGIAAVIGVLWLSASSLVWLARRSVQASWPYVLRQGVANLYRPANQTRAVVLSLGFGAFLISTLYLVQTNLLKQFDITAAKSRGNLVFFDVQDDQATGVDSIMRAQRVEVVNTTPIITMRIAKINRWTMSQMLDTTNPDSVKRATWALRREYRSTYRADTTASEKIIAGAWFGITKAKPGEPEAEVSMEGSVTDDLGVKVGDVITWDVQGRLIPARVTSFRTVNWARLEPNFFAVFSPGVLDGAPKQFVVVGASPDARQSAVVQREAVARYPNVSAIDISLIQRTVQQIVDKVTLAIRFLALFSVAIGIPVLFSAVAATRSARIREGVLLKVLGATADKIRAILLAEYALLGALGALSGMVLSFGGAWAVMTFVFKQPFTPVVAPALGIAAIMLVLAVLIGLLGGRDVFKETPMAALREA
jgi:putative ABC transport system permease protein